MTCDFKFKRITKEEARIGAIIPLSFVTSKTFSFETSNALLLLIEVSVLVFVKFSEVFFNVSVTGSNTFSIFSGMSCLSNLFCNWTSSNWFFDKTKSP